MGISMIIPIVAIGAYRQGIKDGKAISQDKPLPPILKPKVPAKLPKEDRCFDTILSNLDNYDGTSIGQKEVNK